MPTFRSALLALTSVAAVAAILPTTAVAAPCDTALFDAQGFRWDPDDAGAFEDGTNDAFDAFGEFTVERPDTSANTTYGSPGPDACGREDGDREITYPAVAAIDGLEISRKVYVPADDAFGRMLSTITNPTAAPVTVRVRFRGALGSDSNTAIRATSSGDVVHDAADDWVVTDDTYSTGPMNPAPVSDPTVATVFDSTLAAADGLDATSPNFYGLGDDNFEVFYEDVVVPAGASVSYMHLAAQRPVSSTQAAIDAAAVLARGPATAYAGLSDGERAQLRNFPADGDGDGDGLLNRADNCSAVVNSDQANVDGDATGDACDADDDGDGLSDPTEAEFGTNPRAADSDGDGKADRVDGCPTKAGTNADGCPVETRTTVETLRVPSFDRVAPASISARVRRSGRSYTTSGVLVPPSGVSAAQACGFGKVSVQVKAGSNTISTRRVELRSDCRYSSKVVFRAKQRFFGRSSLSFRVRFLGNQRLTPVAAKAVSAKVPSS